MCELFGMSCQAADRGEYSLTTFGEDSDWNRDGWGLAWYDRDGSAQVRKADEDGDGDFVARKSTAYAGLTRTAESTLMIGHLRRASNGIQSTENSHPFIRRFQEKDWVFAHNGSIPGVRTHPRSMGGTDSEQVFHEMMDDLEDYLGRPGFRGTSPGVRKAVRGVLNRYSGRNKPLRFNFLLSDGTTLYAFHHYTDRPLYLAKRQKGYGGVVLISTYPYPLPSPEMVWKPLEKDRLLAVSGGMISLLSGRVR